MSRLNSLFRLRRDSGAATADFPPEGGLEPVIVAKNLTMHYGAVQAVNGIDLCVCSRQIFGFLGENGSGKTTTVRMLTTLLKPTAGTAEVGGLDVVRHADSVRQSIGVALQDVGLDPFQTGRELLRLSAQLYNVREELIEDRVSHLLDVINLSSDADRCVFEYSGGMQRRLDLAAALVHGPSIVFLDEPTTGLDPLSRQRLWDYIRNLNEEFGVTFFLTTQYLEEADQLCDEIAILDAGRIVLQDAPKALKDTVSDDVISFQVTAGDRESAIDRVSALPIVERARRDGVSGVSVYTKSGTAAFPMIVRIPDDVGVSFDQLTLAHATLDSSTLDGYKCLPIPAVWLGGRSAHGSDSHG